MKIKAFEVRDIGTFIPVIAIQMLPDNEKQRYLLRRSGYGFDEPCVVVCRMEANGLPHTASYDEYCWCDSRTMTAAHRHIIEHFDDLPDGAVIDVQHILGETVSCKASESEGYPI